MLDAQPDPHVRVSADGRIVEVSETWNALALEKGLPPFAAAALVGRSTAELLAPGAPRQRGLAWLAQLRAGPAAVGPLAEVCPWAEWLVPWPAGSDLRLVFQRPAWYRLRGPYFRLVEPGSPSSPGRLAPLGPLAESLFSREPELAERSALEERLAFLQPPLVLEATGLLADEAPVLVVRWPVSHRQGGFRLLARVLRAALHDASNSLGGVRMLAEVLLRGGAKSFERHGGTLSGMIDHLDKVTGRMGDVRQLAHTAAHGELLDGRALLVSAAEATKSERQRREIEVDLSRVEPFELASRRDLVYLLLTGAVASSLDRAADGDRLVLRFDPRRRRLELWIDGRARPWWSAEDGSASRFLAPVARAVGARFELGEDDEGQPRLDWALEWPAATV